MANAGSNGLALSADAQQIVAATHDQRNVSAYRLNDRTRSTIAANYQGRAFNSPNDVAVRSDGVVYFTDPNFQRGNRSDQMNGRTSVFRVSNGQVSLVDDRLRQPNGISLSPDGTALYVGAYSENKIYKYAVQPDGSTGARSVFVNYIGGPDGGTIDCAGNVYWTSGFDASVHVYSPPAPSSARSDPVTPARRTWRSAAPTGRPSTSPRAREATPACTACGSTSPDTHTDQGRRAPRGRASARGLDPTAGSSPDRRPCHPASAVASCTAHRGRCRLP
ncbi:SMP-30/gluconolactonase/LRE family protein [Micromonospora sp. M12]